MQTIEIFCENTNSFHTYPMGIEVMEIAEDLKINTHFKVAGAYVNNKVRTLTFNIVKPKNIRFFGFNNPDGKRIYIRSLFFLFYVAFKKVCPEARLIIDHAISRGYYCRVEDAKCGNSDGIIKMVREEMARMVTANLPIERKGVHLEKLISEYREQGLLDKVKLYEEMGWLYSYAYYLDGYVNYFHGHMLPSTYYIQTFEIEPLYKGLLLRLPHDSDFGSLQDFVRQDKLFGIFQEHKNRADILGVPDIGSLNLMLKQGKEGSIIKIAEALHERKIAEIANRIVENETHPRLVLIAGPSSSGKTTFSKRLAVQLAVAGKKTRTISLDNYFVDRHVTPVDENGNYDFEALEAIDIEFFNQQLNQLFNGELVEIPKFSFTEGKRFFDGDIIQLHDDEVLVIEGIHGLNPELIPHIDHDITFKIFISALTSISIDDHNPIATTDNRLIRRMIRDAKYRGYSAIETLRRWPSVRKGEEKNIFPHQENADIMFNSALLYELAVLKNHATPLLISVPENQFEFSEALRLLKILSYFKPFAEKEIPPTSLIREFLGGSSFSYK